MKTKFLIGFALALVMVMPLLAVTPLVSAQTDPHMYLQPSTVTGYDVGDTFDVTLMIQDATNVWQWLAKLQWDPTVLNVTYAAQGSFLSAAGPTAFAAAAPPYLPNSNDIYPGEVPDMSCGIQVATGATGSGDLAVITFEVIGYTTTGDITIDLYDTELNDPSENPITHTSADATFNNPPPSPGGPTAAFTVSPSLIYVGDTVTLDATGSSGGYDTYPLTGTPHNAPITTWTWSIDVGNDGTVDETLSGEIVTFECTGATPVAINLEVYAPDPEAPSHPDFVDTDSTSLVVSQYERPTGAYVDVYTVRGGQGLGIPADIYGPQELVTVFAEVLYNEVPVLEKSVAFEVTYPNGEVLLYRSVSTDENGIASLTFRMPWPGENPELYFGTYNITATVHVGDDTVTDYCEYEFGYIVEVDSVTIDDPAVRNGYVDAEGVFVNKRTIDVNALVSLTVYDECDVPVMCVSGCQTLPAASSTTSPSSTAIGGSYWLPYYAYKGLATGFVNAFSALPANLGIPYCPEYSLQFQIDVA